MSNPPRPGTVPPRPPGTPPNQPQGTPPPQGSRPQGTPPPRPAAPAQPARPVDLATRLDGQRSWLNELDNSLRKRSIVALVLTCLAVGVGAAAMYIAITKNSDSDRITALETRISALRPPRPEPCLNHRASRRAQPSTEFGVPVPDGTELPDRCHRRHEHPGRVNPAGRADNATVLLREARCREAAHDQRADRMNAIGPVESRGLFDAPRSVPC
jgi:hypothetical protein